MPIDEARKAAATGIRSAANLADDAAEYGADLVETGAKTAVGVGKGFIRVPTALAKKIADMLDAEVEGRPDG